MTEEIQLKALSGETLSSLAERCGLSAQLPKIREHVRPAIYITLEDAGSGDVGQSRIGGVPDLPSSLVWPSDARWGYRCFILQINFAQLPKFPTAFSYGSLPAQGMLYLFVNEGGNDANQVIFYDGSEPLQPVSSPATEDLITDWYLDLKAHTLSFQLGLDLPRWATDEYEEMCDRLQLDEDRYEALTRLLSQGSLGKLLGYAAGIGHDPRHDAYVVREHDPAWVYDYERRKQLDMTKAWNWQNLLQLDSDYTIDLGFGDAGYLQVLIHGDDLMPLDVSRVYVNLESS
ncbi:MAG: YwqG family protein [Cyanobacteria bacterium J06650_10]